jgi:type IV pilus assembly protein PilA
MFKKIKNRKGFTLIELIVVIAIIAVLAAIIIPTVANNIARANDARDLANSRSAYADFTVELLVSTTPPPLTKSIPGGSCVAVLTANNTVRNFTCTMSDGRIYSLKADGQVSAGATNIAP